MKVFINIFILSLLFSRSGLSQWHQAQNDLRLSAKSSILEDSQNLPDKINLRPKTKTLDYRPFQTVKSYSRDTYTYNNLGSTLTRVLEDWQNGTLIKKSNGVWGNSGKHTSFMVASSIESINSSSEFITFYSGRNGNTDIYRMNVDGSNLLQLTTNTANDQCPSVSPDGKKIAFLSERDGSPEIYLMNADGTIQTRITNNTISEEHPSWSPDGTKIFFIRDYSSRTEIWVMNTDGSNSVRLTNNQCRDERPFLSPDGQTILFMSNRNGNYEIYMMNTDGSNQRRITNSAGQKVFPTWSPDGGKIAYSINDLLNRIAEIHVMNSDGTGDTAITTPGGRNENPIWSPDGNRIVFQSERDGNFEVYVMNSNGSNQTRLTNNSSWDGWPSWGSDTTQTGINDKSGELHHGFRLYQNYPNPFNPSSKIKYSVPQIANVVLKVYDILGNEIETLVLEEKPAGSYELNWTAGNLPSGVYFYRLQVGDFVETKKMILMK